jgi:hypothetical protein
MPALSLSSPAEVIIPVLYRRRAATEGSPAFQGRDKRSQSRSLHRVAARRGEREEKGREPFYYRGLKPPATINRPSGTKKAEHKSFYRST